MSKTIKTVIAVILGILVVLSIIPVFSFVAWGGYSNSEAENRIMRAERESELNRLVLTWMSHFSLRCSTGQMVMKTQLVLS